MADAPSDATVDVFNSLLGAMQETRPQDSLVAAMESAEYGVSRADMLLLDQQLKRRGWFKRVGEAG